MVKIWRRNEIFTLKFPVGFQKRRRFQIKRLDFSWVYIAEWIAEEFSGFGLNLIPSGFGKQALEDEVKFAMAVGKKPDDSLKLERSLVGDGEMILEFVRCSRSLGRKRVVISGKEAAPVLCPSPQAPSKKHCGDGNAEESERFPLESLPPDVLMRVLCGVEHDDLKTLLMVSKSIKEAALIAKRSHFAYSTPKKFPAFRTEIEFVDLNQEIEAPAAPKRKFKPRSIGKDVSSISIDLFPSTGEGWWRRKPLLMEEKL